MLPNLRGWSAGGGKQSQIQHFLVPYRRFRVLLQPALLAQSRRRDLLLLQERGSGLIVAAVDLVGTRYWVVLLPT